MTLLLAGILLAQVQMAPDGTYVWGQPRIAPDGTYVGGTPRITPDGTYVGKPDPKEDEDGDVQSEIDRTR